MKPATAALTATRRMAPEPALPSSFPASRISDATTGISEPAVVSVRGTGATAPTLPGARKIHPLPEEDLAALSPRTLPAPGRPPLRDRARREVRSTPHPRHPNLESPPLAQLLHHMASRHFFPRQILVANIPLRPPGSSWTPAPCRKLPAPRTVPPRAWWGGKGRNSIPTGAETRCRQTKMHQACSGKRRCRANKSWMDCENARARARPRAEQNKRNPPASGALPRGQRRAKVTKSPKLGPALGSPCASDDLPHTIPYHGGLRLSSPSRPSLSYQPVAVRSESGGILTSCRWERPGFSP